MRDRKGRQEEEREEEGQKEDEGALLPADKEVLEELILEAMEG